jgi:hypothetical protein
MRGCLGRRQPIDLDAVRGLQRDVAFEGGDTVF